MSDMAIRIAKFIFNCNSKSIMSKKRDIGGLLEKKTTPEGSDC